MSLENLGIVEFEVDGETVSLDLDNDFDIEDIDQGMSKTSALIAYFGVVYGAAVRKEKMVTARYRHWKAQRGAGITDVEPKMAQTKVNQIVEGDPDFLVHKDRQADAARNVEALRRIVEAFAVRASLLQSKGAMNRAEFMATGMTTKLPPGADDTAARAAVDASRTEVARAAVEKTKKAKTSG